MKSASGSGSTFDLYEAVMCFYDLSGDGKSEAGAAGLVGYERLKYPHFLRGGHAASIVTNGDMYIISSGFGTKTYNSMWIVYGFLCVSKKIQTYLPDFQRIQREFGEI